MSIKSILNIFSGLEPEAKAVEGAFALGKILDAQIRVLHLSPDPNWNTLLYVGTTATVVKIEEVETEVEKLSKRAKELVVAIAKRQKVFLDEDGVSNTASAKYVHRSGGRADAVIIEEGRLSDLIVIGHDLSELNNFYDYWALTSLFNTGRPVLILPVKRDSNYAKWDAKTVSIAWNGSLEATRALQHAIPFLKQAKRIHILMARNQAGTFGFNVPLLSDYLKAHGIDPGLIILDSGEHTERTLLEKAKELKSDLLVMGAYGHNRYLEIILGGVTEYMLNEADIPVLLAH